MNRLQRGQQDMIHRGDTGIVDQGIEPAVFFADRGQHLFHRVLVGNVQAMMRVPRRVQVSCLPAAPDHLPALLEIMLGKRTTDPLAGAGDQHDGVMTMAVRR